ncbi:metal-dependent phosphohydrolase [Mycobacterium sp. MS1601]|uniref:HD domain-containing protein n=1 Tax=Mycobacterium sp. MS1601 TaxID=1936029 RepID=UPI00097961A2|nr:metal-dependent phosphohydrolase [Mycobacterium sp. MS1601]AQA02872.1 metal-dependent phosphohydrolase [Mycobacterium sp. MS1601]
MQDLLEAWDALLARHTSHTGDVAVAGQALLARWAEPHRRYHDLAHLRAILASVEELSGYAADADAVRLAAWYHDAVYAGRSDDEERSAQLAESDLAALGVDADLVAEVARLVRMTLEHNPAAGDTNAEALSDADLAGLALPRELYQRNSALIRQEYAHVSDADFRAARARVIEALLAGPGLYRTPLARREWEARAVANMNAELASLR